MIDFEKRQEAEKIEIKKYIDILWKKKLVIAIFLMTVSVIAVSVLSNKTPIYTAKTTLNIEIPRDPRVIESNSRSLSNFQLISMYYQTQRDIISSDLILGRVVENLNLVDAYIVFQKSKDDNSLLSFFSTKREREKKNYEEQKYSIINDLKKNLKVEGGDRTELLTLSVESVLQHKVHEIANSIAQEYIKYNLKHRNEKLVETSNWLDNQLNDIKLKLNTSEDELRRFSLKNNLVNTNQQEYSANTQLENLNKKLIESQNSFSKIRELHDRVEEISSNPESSFRSLSIVINNDIIRDIVAETVSISRKIDELDDRYGNKHPKMIALKADLKSANASLDSEVDKIVKSINIDYVSSKEELSNIKALISEKNKELIDIQKKNFALKRMEREVANNAAIYESYLKELAQSNISENYDISNVKVIDDARLPARPSGISKSIILLGVLVISFGFISVLIITLDMFKSVIVSPDDVEKYLSVPLLGFTIKNKNLSKNSKVKFLARNANNSPELLESFKSIRTNLFLADTPNLSHSFLVTSSNPLEGKSVFSLNLATVMSQLGKTALVELDLRKPTLLNKLALANDQPGIEAYLKGTSNSLVPRSVDGIEGIELFAVAHACDDAPELLAGQQIHRLFAYLKENFDYVVVDSPPCLAVTDSLVLTKLTDRTVLCAQSNHTKVTEIKESIKRLNKVDANISGIVITQVSPKVLKQDSLYYNAISYYG
ncbi:GumC family protein [Salinimonas sediminis]|uniref:Polysaccharide biosynthesis tyrosine autokinase n=1 Tax=Salinimonas sediminis TaxID=2303538 RepID=A0A346NMV6_9ALTE|nr:polysaccharide biosynthesis tyrosine autokinase [Salinimonas sediminis]AXR06863.1 hypothetical protein D0Y50_11140 [Salinimonas sediminis]